MAHVRALARVDAPVIVPHALLQKCFPAEIAHVIAAVFVDGPNVSLQRIVVLERLPAQVTYKSFFLVVRP